MKEKYGEQDEEEREMRMQLMGAKMVKGVENVVVAAVVVVEEKEKEEEVKEERNEKEEEK